MDPFVIDTKKVVGENPSNVYEAIDKMNKAHQEIFDALFIMKSIIEFKGDDASIHEERIVKYLKRFCK